MRLLKVLEVTGTQGRSYFLPQKPGGTINNVQDGFSY